MRRFLFKCLCFVPLVVLIAGVNGTVDPARYYRSHFLDPWRDRYEGTVIDNLLAGRSQSLIEPYSERIVHEAVFRSKRPIDVVVLGSSVAKAINGDSFRGQSFYNASVYGGELEESVAIYQLAWEAGRRPKRVVIEMHGRELSRRSWDVLPELVSDVLHARKRLGLPSDDSENTMERLALYAASLRPDDQAPAEQLRADEGWLHPYDKLFSPRYFEFSVRSLTKDWFETSTESTNPAARLSDKDRQVLCPDGSVLWSPNALAITVKQIRQHVKSDAFKPDLSRGPAGSASRRRLFDAFVSDLEKAGCQVDLVLVPPFPAAFDRMRSCYEAAGQPFPIVECEAHIRDLARSHRIQIDGSLDPRRAGVRDDEFVDYIHMRREGLNRLIAGGKK